MHPSLFGSHHLSVLYHVCHRDVLSCTALSGAQAGKKSHTCIAGSYFSLSSLPDRRKPFHRPVMRADRDPILRTGQSPLDLKGRYALLHGEMVERLEHTAVLENHGL